MKNNDRNNLVIKIQYRGNENFEKKTTQYSSRPATCCYPYYNIIICYNRVEEKIGYKNFFFFKKTAHRGRNVVIIGKCDIIIIL